MRWLFINSVFTVVYVSLVLLKVYDNSVHIEGLEELVYECIWMG